MKNKNMFTKINRVTTMFVCCILFCFACFIGTFFFLPQKSVMAVNWSIAPSDLTFLTTGDGSVSNPYKISTAEQLATVSKNIATYKTKSFKLIRNLDISKYNWVPIGTATNQYSGTFDGDGCSISGIRIDAGEGYIHAGLFGYLSGATIKNLTMVDEINTYVVAKSNSTISFAGVIAGYVIDSTFSNILNFNVDVYSLSKNMISYAGGIVGLAYNSTFNRVVNMGNVNSLTGSAINNTFAGGIVGCCYNGQIIYTRNDGIINSLYSKTFNSLISLSAYGSSPGGPTPIDDFTTKTYAGGIAGYCETNISLSYNTNNINAGINTPSLKVAGENTYALTLPFNSFAGGIVGYTKNAISDSYNLGNITSNATEIQTTEILSLSSADFFGEVEPYADGRLKGYYNTDLTAYADFKPKHGQTKYYNTLAYAGGIAGYSSYEIKNCYNDGQISGGKKVQNIIVANTIAFAHTTGSIDDPGTLLYKYIFFADVTFTYARYYSDINGNLSATTTATYGAKVTNDYSVLLTTSLYDDYNGYGFSYESIKNNLSLFYIIGQTISSNKLGITTQSVPVPVTDMSANFWQNYFYSANYNIRISIAEGSTVTLNIFMDFKYSYYTKLWWKPNWDGPYPSENQMALNITNLTLNQRINNYSQSATNLTVSDLSSSWSKTTGTNGNRPYITNFYW